MGFPRGMETPRRVTDATGQCSPTNHERKAMTEDNRVIHVVRAGVDL